MVVLPNLFMTGSRHSVSTSHTLVFDRSAMAFILLFGLAFTSLATATGIAASAPTAGPSKATGKLPALGYALSSILLNIYNRRSPVNYSWNTWNAYGCGGFNYSYLSSSILINFFSTRHLGN